MRDNNRLKRRKALNLDSLTTTKNYLEDMARAGWMLERVSGMNLFEFDASTAIFLVISDEVPFPPVPNESNKAPAFVYFAKNRSLEPLDVISCVDALGSKSQVPLNVPPT